MRNNHIEPKDDIDKVEAFETARKRLADFLQNQGIFHVNIELAKESPCQNPNSGKFKHIINMK